MKLRGLLACCEYACRVTLCTLGNFFLRNTRIDVSFYDLISRVIMARVAGVLKIG